VAASPSIEKMSSDRHVVAEIFAFERLTRRIPSASAKRGFGNFGGEDGVFALFLHAAFFPFVVSSSRMAMEAHSFLDPIVGVTFGLVERASAFGGEFRVFNFPARVRSRRVPASVERLGLGTWNA